MIGLILTAAGLGSRFGDPTPKQFHQVSGIPVFVQALIPFVEVVDETALVVPLAWLKWANDQLSANGVSCTHVVSGGEQRQDSVGIGLKALSQDVDRVLVHDGARPFVTAHLIQSVLSGIDETGACIPGLPVSETVKEVEGARVVHTLTRDRLRLIQTPQGFRRDILEEAYRGADRDRFYGTDEASLVERIGRTVLVVEGDPANRKVTYRTDLST